MIHLSYRLLARVSVHGIERKGPQNVEDCRIEQEQMQRVGRSAGNDAPAVYGNGRRESLRQAQAEGPKAEVGSDGEAGDADEDQRGQRQRADVLYLEETLPLLPLPNNRLAEVFVINAV